MQDEQIVQLYWNREERAISAIAEKYGKYCSAIAINILGNRQDAEECVNDTYLKAWNSIPPHRPAVLSAFLGKITRNLSLNRFRYNTAAKRGGSELPLVLDELSEIVAGRDDVENELKDKELLEAIQTFLRSLSPKKRSIFGSRYWKTESVSQIAARHGMSAGAVSMLFGRLRENLRKDLLKRGIDL